MDRPVAHRPFAITRARLGLAAVSALLFGAGVAGVGMSPLPAAAATGPSWSSTLAPLPPSVQANPEAEITVTECPSPGNCIAAGDYRDSASSQQGVLEVQANGSWTATKAPLPANASASNAGVDYFGATCTSVGSCVVVGNYLDNATFQVALVETLSNGTWSATEVPLPANAGTDGDGHALSGLNSVACTGPGACEAVGFYTDTNGYQYGLIENLTGTTWTGTEAPLPSNAGTDGDLNGFAQLASVTCPFAGSCVAVGNYYDTNGHDYALMEQGAGGSWTPTQGAEPPNAGTGIDESAYLNQVSCAGLGECVAVGAYQDTSAFTYPLAETLVDATWTPSAPPLPANAGGDAALQFAPLESVSCPQALQCVAVGRYKDTSQYAFSVIDTLNNGTWSTLSPAQPANVGSDASSSQYADLSNVSCSWPGQCVAAGYYQDPSSHDHGFLVSETSGNWSSMESPYPGPGSSNIFLNDVSCVAAMCAVGGELNDASNNSQGFLDTLAGSGGYDMSASDGGIFAFNTPFFGSMGGMPLNKPVVGLTIDPATDGYFEVASDGGMFAFNAPFQGSMGGMPLNQPVVGMAFDTLTGGYYEVASDGGIFAFNAPFYGSMGGQPLNKPIVGIAFDPATGGYYEVASDGGLFAFNAPFLGSMGGSPLNKPVVGMTVDTSTNGYYEVASDGGLFAFGAPFLGSTGNMTLNKPVVGMAFDPYTNGYYEVATDGGIFAYNTPFFGSTGNIALNQPVVGMGST